MYVYSPKFEKKKEKLLSLFLAVLGVALYFASQFPGAPVPGVIQILGVGCLAGAILLISMCVLRSYSYEVVEDEEGKTDFVIAEHYSRRKTVVCRVALADVVSVVPLDPDWKKGKETLYTYTGVLFDEKRYLVEMNTHGEHLFVIICADEALLDLLSAR
jgi:hypothetical protein